MSAGTPIRRRQLGTSDLVVSDVCLGTMTWGKQNTLEEGVHTLTTFDEYGLNFLGDTAEMPRVPTEAEPLEDGRAIGAWLKKRGRRDDVGSGLEVCGASERLRGSTACPPRDARDRGGHCGRRRGPAAVAWARTTAPARHHPPR